MDGKKIEKACFDCCLRSVLILHVAELIEKFLDLWVKVPRSLYPEVVFAQLVETHMTHSLQIS